MSRQPSLGYLVADGGRARLLLRHADGAYETLEQFTPKTESHTPRRDGRTRVFASVGTARSAVESRPQAERNRERFAAELAQALTQAVGAGRFDGFVLAAPPRMLSAISDALAPAVRLKLRRQLARDLTKLPELALRERLESLSLTRELGPLPS